MKGILGKLKGRLVIIVMVVLILAMLPTAWFISNKLNKRIVESQSQAYNEENQKITRASKVTYSLPQISESESLDELSVTRAPNDRVTDWFKEQRELRAAQLETITDRVLELNAQDRTRLVSEFPPPADADKRTSQRAVMQLARSITGSGRGFDRSAYDILFERMGGGTPPDPVEVGESVAEYNERERDLLISQSGSDDGKIDPDDLEELSERLVDRRIGEYRRVAREFSFYGGAEVVMGEVDQRSSMQFAGSRGRSSGGAQSMIPTEVPEANNASVIEGYIWQWDYWFIEDMLRAVGRANVDLTGDLTPVDQSVVKRIESIKIDQFTIEEPDDAANDAFGGSFGSAGTPRGGSDTPTKVTLTGRPASDPSFDTRHATLTVIVSPNRLPEFLDAIRASGLMTVTDVDLQEIDVWSHLSQGYFYGDDVYVMRATIGIESVWLRNWTKDFMPAAVRTALGIADDAPGVDDEG